MKKIVLLAIVLVASVGMAAPIDMSPLTLQVAVVMEQQSQWDESQITEMFEKTNKILSRCSIHVGPDPSRVRFHDNIPMGYETVPLANALYDVLKKPIVLLVNATQENHSAGFAPGSRFLFLSSYSRTPEYQKKRVNSYEPLAHELGHMLGGLTHLDDSFGDNLMSGYVGQQNDKLTLDQCLKIRKHPSFSKQADPKTS